MDSIHQQARGSKQAEELESHAVRAAIDQARERHQRKEGRADGGDRVQVESARDRSIALDEVHRHALADEAGEEVQKHVDLAAVPAADEYTASRYAHAAIRCAKGTYTRETCGSYCCTVPSVQGGIGYSLIGSEPGIQPGPWKSA